MPEKHLYEYAIIRVVPVLEREEFVNVGVLVLCKREKFLRAKIELDEHRLIGLCNTIDVQQLKENLESFRKIADGQKGCGPVAEMDEASRFRWLTAVRSSTIQTSRPHPGLSANLEETTDRLFQELVITARTI